MPHYKNQDKKKKDICYPTTKSFHGELEANILLSLENLQQTGQNLHFCHRPFISSRQHIIYFLTELPGNRIADVPVYFFVILTYLVCLVRRHEI